MHPRSVRRSLVVAAIAAIAATSSGAALGSGGVAGSASSGGCVPDSITSLRSGRLSFSATALRPLVVRKALGRQLGTRFGTRNANGVPTVFGVLAARVDGSCRPSLYKVQLPIRPNGATGWLYAADVRLHEVNTRITVDLSRRRITLFRVGRPVLVTTAVIGSPSTPTPTGHFYVNQRLLTNSPFGDYGPGAVGISAFSPVLLNWPQGGPIAIHGTNAPGLIGFAVSHGCLRVRNADIEKLLRLAVEGTPVEIRR